MNSLSFKQLPKSATGILGLDDITGGGFPTGRPTLICGGAGCGKTLMAMEFLVRGITEFNEPGVFMAFEESKDDLAQNVASLGFDLHKLVAENKLRLDHVRVERSEIEETGSYDLEGLFIRLGYAIDTIKAKRVVLDTIETLFSGLSNQSILRAELRRLFQFLKDKGVTAVITGERGDGSLTRQGLEEYVSDCVILLDNRVNDQVSTRRLRIVKYRGTVHGTNEYPFLIDETGISVLPVTSLELKYSASRKVISSGIPDLDGMLGVGGYFEGSSILVSGFAGTGKSSIASFFANNVCNEGEKCLYFAFEESQSQMLRNMESIGLNLEEHVENGLLRVHAVSPTVYGLEMHLVAMHKAIAEFKPKLVVVDPITNLRTIANCREVKAMLTRLIYFLKSEGITAMFISEIKTSDEIDPEDEGISSLTDTWLMVRDLEANGERNRGLYVLKSRGMHHTNRVREFIISNDGLQLVDVATDKSGNVLVGSAREAFISSNTAHQTTQLDNGIK